MCKLLYYELDYLNKIIIFFKKATLGRPVLSANPLEAKPNFVNAMRSLVKTIRSVHDIVSLKFLVSYTCFSKLCASI